MAIVRLAYKLDDGVNILDLARDMSKTERRLIPQKQVFTIMGGIIADGAIADGASNLTLKISTAPNNFYTRNAITRGFRAWKRMRQLEIERGGLEDGSSSGAVAKYSDFKILLDNTSSANVKNPIDAGDVEIPSGEWNYATMTPDQGGAGGAKTFMIVGPHAGSRYGLAQGWLETRALPQAFDPVMPDLNSDGTEDVKVDFLSTLFQDTVEAKDRIEDIINENDVAPYDYNELYTAKSAYSSSQPKNLQLQFFTHPQKNDLHQSVPGFQALCGLVRVDVGSDYTNPILVIDVDTKGWNF